MAQVPATALIAAARALMLAGRWNEATLLLEGAAPADAAERAMLAVTAAEVAVDQDFWTRTSCGSSALIRASEAVAGNTGTIAFDLEFTRLRHDYGAELFGPDGGILPPDGRDPAVADALASRAAALRNGAPDASRRAGVTFYAGLIAEALRGDADAGGAFYAEALRTGEEAGDELIMSYALRHLGYLSAEAGDADRARGLLERSMELRQRVGCVPHVLAQQLALAQLARDSGNLTWARTVAELVRTWARAFGDSWLVQGAEDVLSAD